MRNYRGEGSKRAEKRRREVAQRRAAREKEREQTRLKIAERRKFVKLSSIEVLLQRLSAKVMRAKPGKQDAKEPPR